MIYDGVGINGNIPHRDIKERLNGCQWFAVVAVNLYKRFDLSILGDISGSKIKIKNDHKLRRDDFC